MNSPLASDITEVEALRLALRQARADIAARDQFLALLSHELRSPMSGIQSWAYVLENTIEGGAAAPVLQALAGIKTGVQQQVRLIDELLDATQVMSCLIALDLQPLQPQIELDGVVDSLADALKAKNITIERAYTGSNRLMLGDGKRVFQVLRNLLRNAIRFSKPGSSVRLGVVQLADEVSLQVIDYGRGIDAYRLAGLRGPCATDDMFETNAAPRYNGLKLSLNKRLLELQHGRLEINSAGHDQGAQFTVYLPVAAVAIA